MKQIKTIYSTTADGPEKFDEAVNAALAEGWKLIKRDVLQPAVGGNVCFVRAYHAELEKEVKPEKVSPVEMKEDEERGCWNCRYSLRRVNDTPCRDCTNAFAHGLNRWEAE